MARDPDSSALPGHGAQEEQRPWQERLGSSKFLPSFGPPEMALGLRHFRPLARGLRGGALTGLLPRPQTVGGGARR